MIYAPHTLLRRRAQADFDENGNPVFRGEWQRLCRCRCDDAGSEEIALPGGRVFRPRYKIVCEGADTDVLDGDEVRVTEGNSLRAEGTARRHERTNWYDYRVIWV